MKHTLICVGPNEASMLGNKPGSEMEKIVKKWSSLKNTNPTDMLIMYINIYFNGYIILS